MRRRNEKISIKGAHCKRIDLVRDHYFAQCVFLSLPYRAIVLSAKEIIRERVGRRNDH